MASSRTRPYSVGSKDGGSGSGADFHTAPWKCARKTYSLNASLVGGTVFRRDASICIARISYGNVAGWVAGCLSQPVLCQNDYTYLKTFSAIW